MLKPLGDRVLIKKIQNEEKTKSGIILKDDSGSSPQYARVVEVGEVFDESGKEIKMLVQKGDKVVVNKYSGTEIKYEGEDYTIIKQEDILAVIY